MSSLHPQVVAARAFLSEARGKAKGLHQSGGSGFQVCSAWTDDVDEAVRRLIAVAISDLPNPPDPSKFAFVALAGYGRRDLAPYSDIDLMLLYRGSEAAIAPLARAIGQMIVDAGLQLSLAVRTPSQARSLAWIDATALTSFVEMRLVEGSQTLFDQFQHSMLIGCKWRNSRLAIMIENERLAERKKFGETIYLLHPNVKRSRGCLRDIQIVRWIGFVCYGERDPAQLADMGIIAKEDFATIQNGYQYLLRLRNQLHFMAGRSLDSLDRPKQMELAKWSGLQGSDGVLPVEEFMQNFFEITSEVRYSSANFVGVTRSRISVVATLAKFLGWPIGKGIRIGFKEIWATRSGLERIKSDPARVLELMQFSNLYNRRIDHRTWRTIRESMLRRREKAASMEAINRFLELIKEPRRLGDVLRRLHELRVLEQIIPAMSHARCLLQFNEYHKYTVDAHCIRAVEAACEFGREDSVLGRVYRGLQNKRILHLALLLHDLGKGFVEDHSEVGRVIAEETASLLKLTDSDRDLLVFLVHQHLLMTHTAFRFDLSQKAPAVQFAKQVGSMERLQHLLVLSCADLAAVGPGALNDWKLNLILQLYDATEAQFGSESSDQRFLNLVTGIRKEVAQLRTAGEQSDPWWTEQIENVPAGYLLNLKPKQLIEELRRLRQLTPDQPAQVWGTFLPERDATEYVIAVRQEEPIGLFHRIAGAMASQGLSILSAEIHTQPGMIAWDRFLVEDLDYDGPPPSHRIEQVCKHVTQAVDPANTKPPTFRRVWKAQAEADAASSRLQPTQIRFDNGTSDRHTIINVFAYDRTGLLYDISKTLFMLNLDLQVAKVSTHLDQVVDVFYVTELGGGKITEPTRLYTLRQSLLRAIEST
ncbi:HD domain-containing protein [Pirellulaceae bacterium SH501]